MATKQLRKIIISSLCIVLNIVGSFIALALRLPIYLDTIGTILASLLFGPLFGAITGALTSLVVGITFDPTSFYYLPVQLVLGFLTGLLFKNTQYFSIKSFLKILIITLICSAISSLITTFAFSGITSSGSAYFVSALRVAGINLLTSVFSVQILSDIVDKLISFYVCFILIKSLPKSLYYD